MTNDPVQWVGLALVIASCLSLMWFMFGWVMGLMWGDRHPEEPESLRSTNDKIRHTLQGEDD